MSLQNSSVGLTVGGQSLELCVKRIDVLVEDWVSSVGYRARSGGIIDPSDSYGMVLVTDSIQ